MKKTAPIPAAEFNVKRYLGTAAYEAKRDEMQKELNHNNVMFNGKIESDEKLLSNVRQPRGIGEENIYYKSEEERDALRMAKGKGKQNKKTGIIY